MRNPAVRGIDSSISSESSSAKQKVHADFHFKMASLVATIEKHGTFPTERLMRFVGSAVDGE